MYLFWCLSAVAPTLLFSFFFFNDTATTEIYTLSLHDALPISCPTNDINRRAFFCLDARPARETTAESNRETPSSLGKIRCLASTQARCSSLARRRAD